MSKQLIETRKAKPSMAAAALDVATFNEADNTVEVVFASEVQVLRNTWEGKFFEVLSCNTANVRLERLNSGGPVVDTHGTYSLKDQFGVVVKAWVDDATKECRATLRLSKREEWKGVVEDIRLGIIRNISVGYRIYAGEMSDNLENETPILRVTDWEPMEISFVPVPADFASGTRSNSNTENEITITKISNINTMTTEQKQARSNDITLVVRTLGLPEEFATTLIADENITVDHARTAAIAEVAKRATSPAPQSAPTPAPDTTEAVRSAERKRAIEIRKAGELVGLENNFLNGLIEGNMSLDEARAAIIDKLAESGPKTNAMHARVGTDETDKVRSAAIDGLMIRAGVAPKDLSTERRSIAQPFTGMSLLRLAEDCLVRAGVSARGFSPEEMVQRAITTSSSDFPVLLGGIIRQTLLMNYTQLEDSWRSFCAVGSVTDFRAHDRLRMGSFNSLDEILENGQLKNMEIKDGYKETIQAKSFGNTINVTRKMIINDDLGFITRLAGLLGRAAGLSIEEDVYKLLLSNPTMGDGVALFHASHGNLGTAGAISEASLEEMAMLMAEQKDPNGNEFLNIRPSILLVNTRNAGNAKVINGSQYSPDATNKLQRPNKSFGLFSSIVDSPRVVTAADATVKTNYYAFANPSILPTIEVAFLNGVQQPRLESRMGWETQGMEWKVEHDYAVGAVDWKGAVKNVGA